MGHVAPMGETSGSSLRKRLVPLRAVSELSSVRGTPHTEGDVSPFLLMDERAMDPDQFGSAIVYSVAETLEEARRDQDESGCGVIIRVSLHGGEYQWEEYIP